MGDATSTYAAYKQLRPIADKSLDNLLKVENLIASREGRRAKKEKVSADKAAKEEAAINKSLDDSGLYKSLDTVFSGIKSVDDANSLLLSQAQDRRLEISQGIKNRTIDPTNPLIETEIGSLEALPKKLRAAEEIMTKRALKYAEDYADGKISKWYKGTADKYSAFVGVKDPKTGETTPNFAFILSKGNVYAAGKTQEGKRVTAPLNQVLNESLDMFDSSPPVNYEAYLKDTSLYAKELGDRETTKLQGPYKIQEQTFGSIKDEVIGFTEGKFGTSDSPTEFAKAVWTDTLDREPEELNETGMDEMKVDYVQNVKNFYDEKYSKTLDPVYERKQKGLQGGTGGGVKNFIELNTDLDEVPLKERIPGEGGDYITHGVTSDMLIGEDAFSFSLPKRYTVKDGGATYEVTNLYLTESGKVAFSGTVKEKKKRDTEEDFETEGVSDSVEKFLIAGDDLDELRISNAFARQIKDPNTKNDFKNIKELKDHLKQVSGIPEKEPKKEVKEEVKAKSEDFSGVVILKSNVKKMAVSQGKTEDEMKAILEKKGVTIK